MSASVGAEARLQDVRASGKRSAAWRRRAHRFNPSRATALVFLATAIVVPAIASAALHDRFAIEKHPGESPWLAASSFEFACLTSGFPVRSIRPVQEFAFRGAEFVRLEIDGDAPERCLPYLNPTRRAVDGTFQWFDGFAGGLLIGAPSAKPLLPTPSDESASPDSPGGEADGVASPAVEEPASPAVARNGAAVAAESENGDRVPDSVWYLAEATLPRTPSDTEVLAALAEGTPGAVAAFGALPDGVRHSTLEALIARGGPAATLSLERIARSDEFWTLRRAALLALNPSMSWEIFADAAQDEKARAIRLTALQVVVPVAEGLVPGLESRASEAQALLLAAFENEKHWEVQRGLLLLLSVRQVREHRELLYRIDRKSVV